MFFLPSLACLECFSFLPSMPGQIPRASFLNAMLQSSSCWPLIMSTVLPGEDSPLKMRPGTGEAPPASQALSYPGGEERERFSNVYWYWDAEGCMRLFLRKKTRRVSAVASQSFCKWHADMNTDPSS